MKRLALILLVGASLGLGSGQAVMASLIGPADIESMRSGNGSGWVVTALAAESSSSLEASTSDQGSASPSVFVVAEGLVTKSEVTESGVSKILVQKDGGSSPLKGIVKDKAEDSPKIQAFEAAGIGSFVPAIIFPPGLSMSQEPAGR